MNNFNASAICILMLLLGCKCKDDGVPTLYLSQESKDYCLYQPGSWWVYQSEQSLQYDTLKITGVQNEILFSKNTNQNFERYKISIEIKQLLGVKAIELETGDRESNLYAKHNGGSSDMLYFDSPSYTKDSISDGPYWKYTEYVDSLSIKNETYHSIKYFSSFKLIEYKNIYWAKHIGIIKLEKPNGEIWNLVNYSVKQ